MPLDGVVSMMAEDGYSNVPGRIISSSLRLEMYEISLIWAMGNMQIVVVADSAAQLRTKYIGSRKRKIEISIFIWLSYWTMHRCLYHEAEASRSQKWSRRNKGRLGGNRTLSAARSKPGAA